jgi:hypothetical protein
MLISFGIENDCEENHNIMLYAKKQLVKAIKSYKNLFEFSFKKFCEFRTRGKKRTKVQIPASTVKRNCPRKAIKSFALDFSKARITIKLKKGGIERKKERKKDNLIEEEFKAYKM